MGGRGGVPSQKKENNHLVTWRLACGWHEDGEKLSVDSDCPRLHWAVGTSKQCMAKAASRRGRAVEAFRRAAFS